MTTTKQTEGTKTHRTSVQPHRLGIGWHLVWRYDPPIVRHVQRDDGTSYHYEEDGESSEGCIMWLADQFATQRLGVTAREIYRLAYREHDGEDFDDEWLATDALRDEWAEYTVSPKQWTSTAVRKLLEDLEDVNYHSFLAKLIEFVEERAPELASELSDWCTEVIR